MEFTGDMTTYFKTLVREEVERYENENEYQEAYDFIESIYDGTTTLAKEWFGAYLLNFKPDILYKSDPLYCACINSIEWDSTEIYEFLSDMNYSTKLSLLE
jgi:hypothetical protein